MVRTGGGLANLEAVSSKSPCKIHQLTFPVQTMKQAQGPVDALSDTVGTGAQTGALKKTSKIELMETKAKVSQ